MAHPRNSHDERRVKRITLVTRSHPGRTEPILRVRLHYCEVVDRGAVDGREPRQSPIVALDQRRYLSAMTSHVPRPLSLSRLLPAFAPTIPGGVPSQIGARLHGADNYRSMLEPSMVYRMTTVAEKWKHTTVDSHGSLSVYISRPHHALCCLVRRSVESHGLT